MICCAACGPESFNYDVGSAVAASELAIVRGGSACSEIYLHQESYRFVSAIGIYDSGRRDADSFFLAGERIVCYVLTPGWAMRLEFGLIVCCYVL